MLLSVLMGGAAYSHYWLQLLPFAAIFMAVGVSNGAPSWQVWTADGLAMLSIISSLVMFLPSSLALLEGWEGLDDAQLSDM